MLSNLSIVVPTAGYPSLTRSLYTFRKYSPGAKIIVIDQTEQGIIPDRALMDVYVWVYRTLGFSKAVNMGIEISDTEFVCVANDDVELINIKMWDAIFKRFISNPKIGAINPASVKGYRNESDNLPCSCNSSIDETNGDCLVCRSYKEEYTEEDYNYLINEHKLKLSPINPIKPGIVIDGLMTWFTVFRRSALDSIKDKGCYFDEHFYPGGGEDYDLMCRMYEKGHRAIGVFDAWAYHHWFGTRINNPPKIDPKLRWNNVDGKYLPDRIAYPDFDKKTNWGLWGRLDKTIPMPECVKVKL